MDSDLIKAFAAARRPRHSQGYVRPAALALPMARKALTDFAAAEMEKQAAYAELAAARAVDSRRYAPRMIAAGERLKKAESAWSRAYDAARWPRPLKGASAGLGAAFSPSGYPSVRLQWCEDVPLRFVGLASDLTRLRHTGYYCDPEGDGELARGVVYQLTAKDGRARYVPAIADPVNSEKDGTGPAMLALADIETADDSSEDAAEAARRDAAERADQLAGYYAESEREYQEAYSAGRDAREKAAEALAEGKAWVAAIRAVRAAFRTRRKAGLVGLAPVDVRAIVRDAIETARDLCESYQDAREKARKAVDDQPGRYDQANRAAWRDGYADGPL